MEDMESYSLALKASIAALLCITLTVLLYGVRMNVKRRKLPPGPFPWPIVGNIPSLGTHPHVTYAKMAERYGNIFTVYVGSARVVVVTNAALAKEVLLVKDAKFASRPIYDLMRTCTAHMNPGGDDSFSLAIWSPKAREMRQTCDRHFMLPRRLEATRGSRKEEVWRTVGLVEKEAQAEKPVDLRHVFEELGLRLSCRSAFNKAFVGSEQEGEGALSPEVFWNLAKEHSKLLVAINPSDIMPFLRPFGDLFGVNKKWQVTYGPFLQVSSTLADWYRKHAPNAYLEDELNLDFLEVMMRKAKEGIVPEGAINRQNIEVLMAGADTTAVTLEWCMLELMRHPHMMQRLRAEVDAKYGDSSPVDEDSLLELPYLQAVVKETLRLHHPAPLSVPHYNTEDTVIGGYLIPAGTSIFTDLWAIQRNPEDWGEDASEFNPDRFLEKDVNVVGSSDLQYIPFGAGRRICPGRQVAVRGIAMATAALVHAFDWEAIPGDELSVEEAAGGLNCRCINPLILRAQLRPYVSLYH